MRHIGLEIGCKCLSTAHYPVTRESSLDKGKVETPSLINSFVQNSDNFLSIWFYFTDTDDVRDCWGRERPSLFFSTSSTCSQTFRQLFAILHRDDYKSFSIAAYEVTNLFVNGWGLRTLKPQLWTSQIWTLIHLVNNFVIVLLCVKSSKLITLEENIISVQQLPVCFPLFFVFSSEVLNSGIKSCFDGVVFQDVVCEECLVYVFGVFTFSVFCYCFYEGFIPKIILVNWLLLFICIS